MYGIKAVGPSSTQAQEEGLYSMDDRIPGFVIDWDAQCTGHSETSALEE
jgi:hypothetical protein